MLLKYFYDRALAHASYLVGCQQAKAAIVVDPGRDVQQYLDAAKQEGMKLVGVAETHIHADYVSGARELADRVNAKLYVSDAGPADWKYEYANQYDSQRLHDGDTFSLGKIVWRVMHTPGHTPESICFIITDQGGGADQPMGIFTGDFVFVGSIGRPDLLEEAAKVVGSAKEGAADLFRSVERFKKLDDYLQLWPAHGAGSACGKGLGAIPSSTVGYEKLFNPALQFDNEAQFVDYILADQPEAPKYFAIMKRVNKVGPKVLGADRLPPTLPLEELPKAPAIGGLIDVAPANVFAAGHHPDSINIPLANLATWAGWLVDYDQPVYLISEPQQAAEAVRILHKIGVDQIDGVFDSDALRQAGMMTATYESKSATDLAQLIESEAVQLVDVRSDVEWNHGHIPQAKHLFLGKLPERLSELPTDKPLVAQCQSGLRSAVASSVLQKAGFEVINLSGGYAAWAEAKLPTTRDEPAVSR